MTNQPNVSWPGWEVVRLIGRGSFGAVYEIRRTLFDDVEKAALKVISMDIDGVDSMVFDEIDTGVSGRMAQVVGEKMCLIARDRQVLCVTHLPQIAALGDTHFVVEKLTGETRTDSRVRRLDD